MTWALRGLIAAAAAIVLAAPAQASTTQEALFQDDAMLVYPPRDEVGKTLDILQGLGVDRVRVTVYWRLVAPDAASESKPSFAGGGPADPAAYPKANWRRYDDLVRLAYDRGIQVNFDVAGPAPDWASTGMGGYANPSADDFGPFAAAVAARYTGAYTPPPGEQNPPPPPPRNPNPLPPLPVPGLDGTSGQQGQVSAQATEGTLPRVNYWSFFNEPNQRVFLMPQYVDRKEASPRIYRALLDAGWNSLQGTGHGGDTRDHRRHRAQGRRRARRRGEHAPAALRSCAVLRQLEPQAARGRDGPGARLPGQQPGARLPAPAPVSRSGPPASRTTPTRC